MKLVNLIICLTISISFPLFAWREKSKSSDQVSKSLYENALLQVENLMLTQSITDSLIFDLLSDAKNFADIDNWADGYEMLRTIMEVYNTNSQSTDPEAAEESDLTRLTNQFQLPISEQNIDYPTFPFQLEVGVDYSLQEFELSFIENDSTIVEELQNPYIGFSFNHEHLVKNNSISLNHRFRLDEQFIYYSLLATYQSNKIGSQNRLDLESYFYHQASEQLSDFLDGQLRYNWSKSEYGKRLAYVNLRVRYKWYFQTDSINSDIISSAINGYYEHFFNLTNSLYFNVIPEYYKERQDLGLSYFQTRSGMFFRVRKNYNQYFEAGSEFVYRDFQDNFSGEVYQNKYMSLEPRVEGELPLNSIWGLELKAEAENRDYRTADEINPNFFYFTTEGLLKYYWGDFKSAGLGYIYERQTNSADDQTATPFVEEENFYSYGLVVNSDIMNFSGLLLNLEYRLTIRTYPNGQESLFYTYYSNRFIHSISGFGWISIGNRWQIQIFANYDNDQDRDNEQNDNRSTIFNVGLIYRF